MIRFFALVVGLFVSVPAFACDAAALQAGAVCDCPQNVAAVTTSSSYSAQSVTNAAPVQELVTQNYVTPSNLQVVQRVVQPRAVYVAPQAVAVQRVYVPQAVQQVVTTPYVQQNVVVRHNLGVRQNLAVQSYSAQNLAVQGYGAQNVVIRPAQNLRVRGALNLGAAQSQRTVTKSKTVTRSGSAGLLGRILGR